ncbi:MAG: hypothetical protein ACK46L_15635 [Synechococcaceae cyanobacterium]
MTTASRRPRALPCDKHPVLVALIRWAPTTAQQILCPPTLIPPTPPTLAPFQTSPPAQLRQNHPHPNAPGASTSIGSASSRPSAAWCSA